MRMRLAGAGSVAAGLIGVVSMACLLA